jgi:hypothetical protein
VGQSAVITGPFALAAPVITAQPDSQTVAVGDAVVLKVQATGPSLTYSWTTPVVALPAELGPTFSGLDGPTLVIRGVTGEVTGNYTCTVSNSGGSATSGIATLRVSSTPDVGRLVNVSCRAQAGTGANQLIAGFAVGGVFASGSDSVLVRASGPALVPFGVTGTLPDPELQLFGTAQGNTLLASNSGWGGSAAISGAAADVGAFAWTDPSSLDSALLATLAIGPYTANISGASGDSGVALAEVYDETPAGSFTPATAHLVNVSARAAVGTGTNVLIAGFVIGGSTCRTVLIRASGPALEQFGVTGAISDPELQLFGGGAGGTTLIASNDDWGGDPEIVLAASLVGAFAWTDPNSADCALLVTLYPGEYTAEVLGLNGASGVALVEVYEFR